MQAMQPNVAAAIAAATHLAAVLCTKLFEFEVDLIPDLTAHKPAILGIISQGKLPYKPLHCTYNAVHCTYNAHAIGLCIRPVAYA